MAYVWYRDENASWTALQLTEKPVDMTRSSPAEFPGGAPAGRHLAGGGVVLFPVEEVRFSETWVLLWGAANSVRVNGLRANTGIKVLADRDEIKVGSLLPMFFSSESSPKIETFAGAESEMHCPRCKRPIEAEAQVVRCPSCSLMYHSDESDRDCWTYSPTCSCGYSTDMDAEFQWTPHDMWE